MHCHVCSATVAGTCTSCRRLFCARHWGGAEAPRCAECHQAQRRSLFVVGGAMLLLGVALALYVPGPPVAVPLLLLSLAVLWLAARPFRSAALREAARRPELQNEPPEPENLAESEAAPCLVCGGTIPTGSAQCPACGWSYAPPRSGPSSRRV